MGKKLVAELSGLFFIETYRLEDKKDVVPYIRAEASRLFRDDRGEDHGNYFYSYNYDNGVLHFLIARSNAHIEGKLPAIAAVFFTPGKYMYRSGLRYIVIEHHGEGEISSSVAYDRPEGCIDLTDVNADTIIESLPGKIPKSLYFKWSMGGNNVNVNLILACTVFLGLCNLVYQGHAYDQISGKARDLKTKSAMTPEVKQDGQNLSAFPDIIREISAKMGGKGRLSSIKGDGTKLTVNIVMENEIESREFIKKNGGIYENGKVVLGFGPAAGSAPDSRR